MHVVWVTPALEPVYARQFREAELGAELRALEQAEQLELAAAAAGVPLELLAAVLEDETHFDAALIGDAGELGPMQLLPGTPWWRGWLAACWRAGNLRSRCDGLNVLWGAYALRDALDACGGDVHQALGFYRTGRCVAGPRGAATLELAEWLEGKLADEVRVRVVGGHAAVEVEVRQAEEGLDAPLSARAEAPRLVAHLPDGYVGPRAPAEGETMSVRAKFAVQSREETGYGWGVKLSAVTGGGASEENKSFFKATPSGTIELRTVNPEAAAQFIVGKEYYIDFTPADPS